VGFAWLIAGELLGRRRWLQTLATGAVALQPQLSNVTATVNPHVFLAAIWSAALYLMVVILKRGPTRPRTAALVALCVLSGFTHGRGVALVVPALLTLGLAVWKARRPGRRLGGRSALALMGLGAIVTAPVFVLVALDGRITSVGVRQFASYLWQFYLPRLQSMTPLATDYGFRDVMVERFYGGFARLEINFSAALNDALWTALIAVALSAAVALALERRVLRERWDVVAMLVASVAATMALLHAVAYRTITTGGGDPVITGRYLLPLVTLYGVTVALAVHWLPRRLGVAVGGALLAGLTLLQLGALGITVERFYA
jgi:hypothetical protein